jgi:hypothetical protein
MQPGQKFGQWTNATEDEILTDMLQGYPTAASRYLTFDSKSKCASDDYHNQDWPWRRSCIDALIKASLWSQRYAVLPDVLRSVFDVGKLGSWFPVLAESQFRALTMPFQVDQPIVLDVVASAGTVLSASSLQSDTVGRVLIMINMLVNSLP